MDNNILNNQGSSFLKTEEKEFQTFYKREMWWVSHRALLRKIGLGVFIVFDGFLVALAGWWFLDAYVLSYNQENYSVAFMALSGQSELRDFSQSESANPLSLGEVFAAPSGDEKNFDFYATVANQNSDWYATFKYAFKMSGGETAEFNGFVLPAEERPLVVFKAATANVSSVDLILRNVEWHRVDPHQIPDYQIWFTDHLPQITEAAFSRGDGTSSAAVSFKVKNQTAYNFYQPSFVVALWRGGSLGGVIRITPVGLTSGEEKTVSAGWLGANPAITKVEVFPEINFFDPQAYSSPEGIQTGDVRTQVKTR